MRILQLNTYCGTKSTGKIAYDIAKYVDEHGGECRIGYGVPDISAASECYSIRVGTPIERKVHGAVRKIIDGEGLGSYFATQRLIHQMRFDRPDLVHLHNIHGCYLHLPSLFCFLAKTNIPIVWTLHDCWPFTGHCAYFDFAECDKWKTGCYACPQQKNYPICIGVDRSKQNWKRKKKMFSFPKDLTFVVPCEWMAKPLKQSFLGSYPFRIITNGVDQSIFHPIKSDIRKQFNIADNQKVCLAVASEWDARKGFVYLTKAASQLGSSYVFVVVGLSKEQKHNLPSNMIAIERTFDQNELAKWYSAADCFVNPTLEDNMPMVNLEAISCGTPVVAFDTGGCKEAVSEGCGEVIPQKDLPALCNAIEKITQQNKIQSSVCLEKSIKYNVEVMANAYYKLYEELLK